MAKSSAEAHVRHESSFLRLVALVLLLGWLLWLVRSLLRLCKLVCRDRPLAGTPPVPPWAYRQPDPLIYSQQYLQAQGLAVTWDNPDVHLEVPGAPGITVDPHHLEPDTDYLVIARVWNGSTTAPAVGLPVRMSYLDFGIGTTRHDIGMIAVNLAVKGATGCPAFAAVPWHTPTTPGHYCIQVELLWDDDANPANNMGQQNTDVKALNSPHATFAFELRNDSPRARALRLAVDSYAIPPLDECQPESGGEVTRGRIARHERASWPVPAGWNVVLNPAEVRLEPGTATSVNVEVTAPDRFNGRQAINVNAYAGEELVGGVTVYAEGTGV